MSIAGLKQLWHTYKLFKLQPLSSSFRLIPLIHCISPPRLLGTLEQICMTLPSQTVTLLPLMSPWPDLTWLLCLFLGRNEPLKKERPKWKSEYPMTEGQLRSKRDEFWDTAPAFDGRKEIWDALRAAALAAECNDLELAQAIVDGACITLPHGMTAPECTLPQTRARLLKYGNPAL